MNRKKLNKLLENSELMYLATSVNDQPHVRCVALIYFNENIWFCTRSGREKIGEIEKNDKIEFCTLAKGEKDLGSIRGTGKAVLISDIDTKTELSKQISFFNAYWKDPQDSDFVLYRLDIETFTLHDPENKKFYKLRE